MVKLKNVPWYLCTLKSLFCSLCSWILISCNFEIASFFSKAYSKLYKKLYSRQKTFINIGILIFKVCQVVFTALFYVGNPVRVHISIVWFVSCVYATKMRRWIFFFGGLMILYFMKYFKWSHFIVLIIYSKILIFSLILLKIKIIY